ncbi:MAG TPA: hypothetical protein VE398_08070 [Acidobacteriota bacterium]|nr:hypothetical protein [Acidobacteriota bacterium]
MSRVSGLYRLCWVMTVLLSAMTVVSYYDGTKEFSGYGPRAADSSPQNWREMRVMNIPDVGTLYIPSWLPPDPDAELRMAQQCQELARKGSSIFVVSEMHSINWIKMLSLMFGSTLVFACLIQGTAAVLVRMLGTSRHCRNPL